MIFWKRFYLLLQRWERGEKVGERILNVREIHRLVASHMPPAGALAHKPGMCPAQESNWWSEPHQPEPSSDFLLGFCLIAFFHHLHWVGIIYESARPAQWTVRLRGSRLNPLLLPQSLASNLQIQSHLSTRRLQNSLNPLLDAFWREKKMCQHPALAWGSPHSLELVWVVMLPRKRHCFTPRRVWYSVDLVFVTS